MWISMFFIKFLGKIENILGDASNIFNFTLEFNEKHFNPHFYVVKNEINSRNFFWDSFLLVDIAFWNVRPFFNPPRYI